MAAFPDELQRAVTANPLLADALTNAGDNAATNLRLIYILEQGDTIAAANKPLLELVKQDYKNILKNVDDVKKRERDTRVQKPLTKVPAADYGAHTDVTRVKLQGWQLFKGDGNDPGEVTRWLGRVLTAAEGQQLTLNATAKLMLQMSTGTAQDYIEQMIDEGKTLKELIELLEMRWGGLEVPEKARATCNSMRRELNEDLSPFLDRLRHMARVACRYETDDDKRRKDIDELVKANISRVLPVSVKSQLEERLQNLRTSGAAELTSREIESVCLKMEKARLEKKQDIARQLSQFGHKKGKAPVPAPKFSAMQVAQFDLSDSDMETELAQQAMETLSPPASDDEDPGVEREIFLAKQIAREKQKFKQSGQPVNQKRVMKGAIRKYNNRYAPKNQPRVVGEIAKPTSYPQPNFNPRAGAIPNPAIVRAPIVQQPVRQPPNPAPDYRNRPILELVNLSNCQRGQCIQCGLRGHLLGRDDCPLKDKPLMDAPCNVCGQGLHAGNDCVNVFQQNFIPPDDEAINQIEELHLN